MRFQTGYLRVTHWDVLPGYVIPDGIPAGYTLGGLTPRQPDGMGHFVVCKDGWIVFDPWSGPKEGQNRPDQYTIIYPLNPADFVLASRFKSFSERFSYT
jgi:hypothetical protein